MVNIILLHTDFDWEVLYINGMKVVEDHGISPMELYYRIKLHFDPDTTVSELAMDEWWADSDWAYSLKSFPLFFNDVKVRF